MSAPLSAWIDASADALFICHQIDSEMGGNSCIEAKAAVSRVLSERVPADSSLRAKKE